MVGQVCRGCRYGKGIKSLEILLGVIISFSQSKQFISWQGINLVTPSYWLREISVMVIDPV